MVFGQVYPRPDRYIPPAPVPTYPNSSHLVETNYPQSYTKDNLVVKYISLDSLIHLLNRIDEGDSADPCAGNHVDGGRAEGLAYADLGTPSA